MTNAAKFLDAYNTLESGLRSLVQMDRYASFAAVAAAAARQSPVVRRHLNDLREFAELRNAIVHDAHPGGPIAEPSTWATEYFCDIREKVLAPPTVQHFVGRHTVVTLEPSQPIGPALILMAKQAFSQVPIYRLGNRGTLAFVGLLTSNTVARWLGAHVENDLVSLAETDIAAVLQHTEDVAHVDFVPRAMSLAEVLERFQRRQLEGHRLEAIIVTEGGQQNQAPLAILTTEDLTEVSGILAGRPAG
jgi:hypothetical protein